MRSSAANQDAPALCLRCTTEHETRNVTTLYGIRNCDTMKKAFTWLAGQGVPYTFHDYKSAGIDSARLQDWSGRVGWETLLNTRGTTWRKLSAAQQSNMNQQKALALMAEHPSLIKRPVLEHGTTVLVGFSPEHYRAAFGSGTP